jgi:hypothetical protein
MQMFHKGNVGMGQHFLEDAPRKEGQIFRQTLHFSHQKAKKNALQKINKIQVRPLEWASTFMGGNLRQRSPKLYRNRA